jgi:hypothetical protein
LADPANALKMQGGGRRSMKQFLPAFVHAIWYFAKAKNPLPPRTASPTATTRDVKFKGHQLAHPRCAGRSLRARGRLRPPPLL